MIGQLKNSALLTPRTVQSAGQAAEFYATEFGWRVFPCHSIKPNGKCSCGKDCGKNAGKHPRYEKLRLEHGCNDATTDLATIRHWQKKWPEANWAIATGNGLAVVDIDPKSGGHESLAARVSELGSLPRTHVVRTGSGGLHFYLSVSVPVGCNQGDNEGGLGDGIDIRGDGGYVIAAPSNHISGGVYCWEGPLTLATPAAMPDTWLKRMPKPKAQKATSTVRTVRERTKATDISVASPPTPDWGLSTDPSLSVDETATYPPKTGWLSPTHERVGKRIWAIVRRCQVTGPKTTYRMLGQITSSCKNIPQLRNVPAEALLPAIRWWFDDGVEHMSDKSWPNVRAQFISRWAEWAQPEFGAAWDAGRALVDSGVVEVAENSETPGQFLLKELCTEMQRAIDNGIYHLSSRMAADVLNKLMGTKTSHTTTADWLRGLVVEGFLVKPSAHERGSLKAQRYQTAEAAARCDEHDRQHLAQTDQLPAATAARVSTPTALAASGNRLTAVVPLQGLSQAGRDEPTEQTFATDLAATHTSVSQRSAVPLN